MSSLTRGFSNIQKDGPTLEVHFLLPEDLQKKLHGEGKKLPEPIIVKALIDTGASNCVIGENIPKKLGLKPVNKIKITTPSCKDYESYQYFLRMLIPDNKISYEGVFTVAPLCGQEIDALIGRDLLSNCVFIYTGYINQFTLSF